jgi:hypothetical protein
MFTKIKKSSLKLSLIAALAVSPFSLHAATGGGMVEGSSESTSAGLEDPAFEKQLNRINVGINLIRINTDMLENMPVSQDSKWVDEVIAPFTGERARFVRNMDSVKNDAYYSTASITDAILGRRQSLVMSPLIIRLYSEAAIIYKNRYNGYSLYKLDDAGNEIIPHQKNPNNPKQIAYHIPNMNQFPDITDTKSYVTFNGDKRVAMIDVEATSGNRYNNVKDAVISLLPEGLQEGVNTAADEFKVAKEEVGIAKSAEGELKAWMDDDKNANSPEKADKEAALEAAKADVEAKEKVYNEKEEAYFSLLAAGAKALESDFDATKVPLAKKLEALLDAIDNNAFGAASMFVSATAGLVRGYGMVGDEIKALRTAQALSSLVGNQKEFISERLSRMLMGSLLALPNIGIGTYYATSQSHEIGKYQDIVAALLDAAKVAEEAQKATQEAQSSK